MPALNEQFFTNMEAKIDSITVCEDLQEYANEVSEFITKQLEDLLAEATSYADLLISPTDLGSVITWINTVISKIQGPYIKSIVAQAQLAIKYAQLTQKLITKAASLTNCQITVPPPPSIDMPEIPTPPIP